MDFVVEPFGEVTLLRAQTVPALAFISTLRGATFAGAAVVLEPLQVLATVRLVEDAGFTVQKPRGVAA